MVEVVEVVEVGAPVNLHQPPRPSTVLHRLWPIGVPSSTSRSEEHTSELQSLRHLVCRLLLEKKTYTLRDLPTSIIPNRAELDPGPSNRRSVHATIAAMPQRDTYPIPYRTRHNPTPALPPRTR